MRRFGRRIEFDEKSRDYPVRALLADSAELVTRRWHLGTVLDQGSEPACVGFAWTHDILADPVVPLFPYLINNQYALDLYRLAQTLDEWPGEDYAGTSILAGAKATMRRGWITEYRWAFGLEDVLLTLAQLGPVVLGVNWYSGMNRPDVYGYIYPEGWVQGGHAILAVGVDFERQAVRLHNSWGADWGEKGQAWITFSDLDRLLHEHGEACVPLVRTNPQEPEPVPEQPGLIDRILDWLWNLITWPFRAST